MTTKFTPIEVLELICDTASQEWQESNGERKGAIDNQGRRLWFIGEDIMQEVRKATGGEK